MSLWPGRFFPFPICRPSDSLSSLSLSLSLSPFGVEWKVPSHKELANIGLNCDRQIEVFLSLLFVSGYFFACSCSSFYFFSLTFFSPFTHLNTGTLVALCFVARVKSGLENVLNSIVPWVREQRRRKNTQTLAHIFSVCLVDTWYTLSLSLCLCVTWRGAKLLLFHCKCHCIYYSTIDSVHESM